MRYLYTTTVGLLFCFFLAAQETGTLQGTITDTAGTPLPKVNVQLLGTTFGTTTDQKGQYQLTGIPEGDFQLRISAVGYKKTIRQVTIAAGQSKNLNLQLQKGVVGLNEVVVSATRSEEELKEIPSSVTVLDKQQIEDQMQIHHNTNDILAQTVPGMAQSTRSGSNFGQNLRGRPTLVMVDGIPQSTPLRDGERDLRTIDPAVLERVEVVKGATAIYGHGATGGFINYITTAPTTEDKINSQTSLNTNGSLTYPDSTLGYRVSQQLSGRIGKWDYYVSGTYENYGLRKDPYGNVIPPDPQLQGGIPLSETINGYGKVGYNINSQHRVQIMYNFYSSEQPNRYMQIPGEIGQQPSKAVRRDSALGDPVGTRANHNIGLTYTGKEIFKNTDLTANIYHQNFETVYSYNTFFKEGGQSMITSEKYGGRTQLNTSLRPIKNIQTDLIYGFDLLNDITAQPLLDGRTYTPDMDLLTYAPFLQTNTTLWEDLSLKAGVRWENAQINVDDYTTVQQWNAVTGGYTSGGVEVKGGSLNYSALTYNVGLSYNPWPQLTPFASYSKGFSLADLGRTLGSAQKNTLQKLKTEPILVDNYEFGIRSAFDEFKAEVNTFASTSELGSSYQQRDDGSFGIVRSPEVVYGFEVAASVQPIRDLTINLTYTYLEGKRDVNDNGSYDDAADAYLPGSRISPPKFTQDIRYRLMPNWTVGLSSLYSLKRDRFPNSSAFAKGTVEDYFVTDLMTSYQWKMLNFKLGIENLFNNDYYPAVSQWYNLAGFGYVRAPGRRFNLTIQLNL